MHRLGGDHRHLNLEVPVVVREGVRHLDLLERLGTVYSFAQPDQSLEDLANRVEQLLGGPLHLIDVLAGAVVVPGRGAHRLRRRFRGLGEDRRHVPHHLADAVRRRVENLAHGDHRVGHVVARESDLGHVVDERVGVGALPCRVETPERLDQVVGDGVCGRTGRAPALGLGVHLAPPADDRGEVLLDRVGHAEVRAESAQVVQVGPRVGLDVRAVRPAPGLPVVRASPLVRLVEPGDGRGVDESRIVATARSGIGEVVGDVEGVRSPWVR
ncbi:MAG: hypothetical protein M3548_13880, partial [Actinomycetota bacterium]|nr:hypothetical protein [Actinomycetota bacterium]